MSEKRLQFQSKPNLQIELKLAPESYGLFAKLQPIEFRRMISNLVNNAVEALGDTGAVSVGLSHENGNIILTVADNGNGILPEILAKLGQKGETHGKAGGSGLGLYHARTTAESWGGSLIILSEVGKGTTVTVRLPKADSPATNAALIDDDALVHMTWKMVAKQSGITLRTFKTPEAFLAADIAKDAAIYIDSDLGNGIKGEKIAEKLFADGYKNIVLATGHAPDSFPAMPWIKQIIGKEPPWQE